MLQRGKFFSWMWLSPGIAVHEQWCRCFEASQLYNSAKTSQFDVKDPRAADRATVGDEGFAFFC